MKNAICIRSFNVNYGDTLSLVCPVVILKYDLRKYVNTFMARGQTSVGKYNPACGMFLS